MTTKLVFIDTYRVFTRGTMQFLNNLGTWIFRWKEKCAEVYQ